MGDPKKGGRFTVTRYHSAKTVSEDAWQHDRIELLPLNPDYDPIPVAAHEGPEMVVVGEWVASVIEKSTRSNVQRGKPAIPAGFENALFSTMPAQGTTLGLVLRDN